MFYTHNRKMKNLILLMMPVMLFAITGCSTLCKEKAYAGK